MRRSRQQLIQRYGLTALIGALVFALLAVIGYETQWGSSLSLLPASAVGQVAKSGDISLLPAFGLPALDTGFKETLERPLFLPTRRPLPTVVGAGQLVMKKGQFRLAGTIVNQDLPYAFLVEIATGKGMRVARGAEISSTGISVATIDGARVVLKQGEETEEITLRTASSPPQTAPPPGVPGIGLPGQRPPQPGVVVSGIPAMPGPTPVAPVPGSTGATMLQPGSSALPGFVQSPPGAVPNAPQANPVDSAVGNQRRRRFPSVPAQ